MKPTPAMKIFALQYDIAWEDRAANIATVQRLAAQAAPPPGSLLVLPEMAFTGFSMKVDRVADTAAREAETAMLALARNHRCWVIGGLVRRAADGRGTNAAVLCSPDGAVVGSYAKIHPYSHGGEDRFYAAGHDVVVWPCGPHQLSPMICYDLRFPEIFRTAARRGATLLVVIANWLETRHEHWPLLLRARAVENEAWVVGVNRCGRDRRNGYRGGSCLIDPTGQVVAQAGEGEGVLVAEADLERVRAVRESFPVLDDLRPEWTRE
jgi:predicted amidohydrolase